MQRLSSRRLHTGLAVASAAILVPCVAALGDVGAGAADAAATAPQRRKRRGRRPRRMVRCKDGVMGVGVKVVVGGSVK